MTCILRACIPIKRQYVDNSEYMPIDVWYYTGIKVAICPTLAHTMDTAVYIWIMMQVQLCTVGILLCSGVASGDFLMVTL